MLCRMHLLLLLACARPTPAPPPPPPAAPVGRVALTIDDLPWQTQKGVARPSLAEVQAMNATIRDTLLRTKTPAAVFFNADALSAGDRLVEDWKEAGFTLGNHTWSHAGLHRTPVEEWLEDVARCQTTLEARAGEIRYFRYPYLQQGPDLETRDRAAAGLRALSLTHAPVTVATSEWVLAFAWRNAAGDAAKQAEIAASLRQHMLQSLNEAQRMAIAATGRDVAQITLVHANELIADQLDEIIGEVRAAGWEIVPLEEALQDPVYGLPDRWARNGGVSWLARVAEDLPGDSYWFGQEEARLYAAWLP